MALHDFCVQPEKLAGIITLAEQKVLQEEARKASLSVRRFSAGHPVAENFKRLLEQENETGRRLRLLMLELFIQTFENELEVDRPGNHEEQGARARLETLLCQMHPADMLDVSFASLAAQVGCTPRHLGRLFQEVVGVSFREKQAEVRLGKAQELLATTKSKVVEVALESGYQSLSLFNFMFKRRFGVTPARWRERPNRHKVVG
jgi:transcriptional regulator GlxA family with amidase domain